MLPLALETIESLKARYPAAIAQTWDVQTVLEDMPIGDRPGKHRQHVFDLRDGQEAIRFVISRDLRDEDHFIHASASLVDLDTMMRHATPEDLLKFMELFQEISGIDGGPDAVRVSGRGIVHLFYRC